MILFKSKTKSKLRQTKNYIYLFFILNLFACQKAQDTKQETEGLSTHYPISTFKKIESKNSGIDFKNQLTFDRDFNIYRYRNYYNGGGVGIGDFNQDGLEDIYFTANLEANALYLNKGDLKFENIAEQAGVKGTASWSTGVSIADVNGDGLLDIYICNSGNIKGTNKHNELFINLGVKDGVPQFREEAKKYGLDDQGFSTHAAFFDYDKDGDLDMYLLNNSFKAIGAFDLKINERNKRDLKGGDKLFRNDNNHFIDVSESAGIYGSEIGFGLGVTSGDVNGDGWIDIYISNDFFERDYLYINQKDGTFKEELTDKFKSISAASMGADMADINNDLLPDIFVTDMLPSIDSRLKQVTSFENWEKYTLAVKQDYHHQFNRNTLQLNRADGSFAEIGRHAGVEASDWSWGALIFDMNNDGLKDIFIANGIHQDITDQDYLQFASNEETKRAIIQENGVNFKALVDSIPSRPIANHFFVNQGDLQFKDLAKPWATDEKGHSNGSAYADLDNDGDLDLIINNVNSEAWLYQNLTVENNKKKLHKNSHFIKLEIKGADKNTFGIGTTCNFYIGDEHYQWQHNPTRGFQSSVTYQPIIGLGAHTTIDSIQVIWADQKEVTWLYDISVDRTLLLDPRKIGQASDQVTNHLVNNTKKRSTSDPNNSKVSFRKVQHSLSGFSHIENEMIDFNKERLIYHMRSNEGPAVTLGDVNNDGIEDVFIGGSAGHTAQLLLGSNSGKYSVSVQKIWEEIKKSENIKAEFFDADSDGDLDLFIANGGISFTTYSTDLKDQLLINNGKGNFTLQTNQFNAFKKPTGSFSIADFDGDGDQDIITFDRYNNIEFGVATPFHYYLNDGKGSFKWQQLPENFQLNFVNASDTFDYDQDGDLDLIIVGEWSSPMLLINNQNSFEFKPFKIKEEQSKEENSKNTNVQSGWWRSLHIADLNKDGIEDIILGNFGTNTRFNVDESHPLTLFLNDFDQNGMVDPILNHYVEDRLLPFVRLHDMVQQLPHLKKRFRYFNQYVDKSMEDLFPKEILNKSILLKASEMKSMVYISTSKGYKKQILPVEAQLAPIFAIQTIDYNADGNLDILMGGNLFKAKPEVGIYDATQGILLEGNGIGEFKFVNNKKSGFISKGEIRQIRILNQTIVNNKAKKNLRNRKNQVLIVRNNEQLEVFEQTIPK